MEPVFIYDQRGQLATVPRENLQSALAAGFRLETPEEAQQRETQAKYGDSEVRAGLEGVARGVTFGLSDPFLKGAGVPREDLKGRKTANPDSALAGEVVGTVGSAVAGPGAGVAKLGTGIERAVASEGASLGTKLLAKGAAGAVEGGVYGAGQAISESALEGTDLSGEKLVAAVGFGALLGGTGNTALGTFGAGAKKTLALVAPKLESESIKGALETFARNRTLKASGFIQKDLNKLSKLEQRETAEVLKELKLINAGDSVEDFLPKAQGAKAEAGKQIGDFYAALDASTNGGAFKYDRLLQRIDIELVQKANPIEREYLGGVMSKELAAFEKQAREPFGSFVEAHQMRVTLDDTINFASEKVNQNLKRRLRSIFDEELKAQGEAVAGKEALAQLKAANRRYGALAKAVDAAESGANRSLGNRAVSMTDYISGGIGAVASIASGNPLPLAVAAGGAILNKVGRERGSSLLAVAAQRLADSHSVQKALARAGERLESGVLGAAGDALSGVRNAGTAPAVTSLMNVAFAPVGEDMKPKDKSQAMVMRLNELSQLATNQTALTDRIAGINQQLGEAPPELKAAVGATLARAVSFLHQVSPKAPTANPLPALQREWRPNHSETAKFERYLRAVSDPLSVLESVRQGRVTREAIEALQAVYPQLTDTLRTSISNRLGDKKKPLPYSQREALKALLGNQNPSGTALLQQVHQPTDTGNSKQPQQGARLNSTRGLQTQSERLASR